MIYYIIYIILEVIMDSNNKPSPFKNPFIMFLILSIAATVGLNLLISFLTTPKQVEVPYSRFIQMVKDGDVKEAVINSDKIVFETKDDSPSETPAPDLFSALSQPPVYKRSVYYYTGTLNDLERLLPLMDEHDVTYYREVPYSNPFLKFIVTWVLPFAAMYVIITLIMRSFSKNMGGGGFM